VQFAASGQLTVNGMENNPRHSPALQAADHIGGIPISRVAGHRVELQNYAAFMLVPYSPEAEANQRG
jgi:hypothetical protein